MKPRHEQQPGGEEPSELTEVFRRPVTPLSPPPGSFEDIRGQARARRRGRVLASSLAVAGCVAAGAVALSMTHDSAPTTVTSSADTNSGDTASERSAQGQQPAEQPDSGTPKAGSAPATKDQAVPEKGSGASTGAGVAQAPATCATSALKVSLGAGEGAAGSQYRPLRITNNTDTPCSLYGFPGVSMVDSGGHQVGKPADRDGAQARGRVVLKPGQVEQATLRIIDAAVYTDSQCDMTDAAGFRVYPPDQKASVVVRVTGLRGCVSSKVTTLTVTSYGVH